MLSKYINDDLRSIGLDIPNISIEDDLNDDRFNICTISNQLAKGLEFDAVIINDTSERIYSSNSVSKSLTSSKYLSSYSIIFIFTTIKY